MVGWGQRSADALGAVVLMGARLYDPAAGRFLSVDPVPGGSSSPYDYCNGDPVNCTDLNGLWGKPTWLTWSNVGKVVAVAGAGACIIASAGACTILAVAGVAISAKQNYDGWRRGENSGLKAGINVNIDAGLANFKAVRNVTEGATLLARRSSELPRQH